MPINKPTKDNSPSTYIYSSQSNGTSIDFFFGSANRDMKWYKHAPSNQMVQASAQDHTTKFQDIINHNEECLLLYRYSTGDGWWYKICYMQRDILSYWTDSRWRWSMKTSKLTSSVNIMSPPGAAAFWELYVTDGLSFASKNRA